MFSDRPEQRRSTPAPSATPPPPLARAIPDVSVVLCARNAQSTLARQLDALRAQEFTGAWELVLVDNASTDDTRDVMDRAAGTWPECRVLVEPVVGLNFARNRGIGAGRGAKVALCDADDEVSPAWLRSMVDALDRFDVVGGALDIDRLNEPAARYGSHHQTHDLPSSFGRPYAVGANLGFKKTVWDAVGGFDDTFSGGGDETDFCLRAQDGGYSIGFEPAAVVYYRLRVEIDRIARQHFDYGRGEERLFAKHHAGTADRGLRTRWRCLATEAQRHVLASPARLTDRGERRQYLERTAFLAGRLVELVRLSSEGRSGGSHRAASTPRS